MTTRLYLVSQDDGAKHLVEAASAAQAIGRVTWAPEKRIDATTEAKR